MTNDDIFALRDAYLIAHPEIEETIQMLTWLNWLERRLHPIRLIERRTYGNEATERDVTPPDPEPPRPLPLRHAQESMTPS